MSINYAVTKKVDKSKGVVKERYYATTRALQKKPVNSVQILISSQKEVLFKTETYSLHLLNYRTLLPPT